MPSMQRNAVWAVIVVAVAVAVALAVGTFWWVARAPTVEAVQLRFAPLVRTLQFSARVATLSRVDIGSTVTGRVTEVLVSEGAQVVRAAVLVRLESDELRSVQAQALAAQQQAAARLAGLRSTGRSAAQAGLAQAQAAVDAAQAEFVRVQQLVAQGFLSASRQDEARRLRDVALAQLAGARAQSQAITEAGTDVAQAQAQLQAAVAATAVARARLAQTELLAPADAHVLTRLVEPGQIVQPGRALLALALAGPTQLSAQVDERFLDQLAVGQAATAVADAYPGQSFPVRVLSISPAVDAQRGAIEVKFALVQQAPAFLRQDMSLSVEVETARRERALAVPASALDGATDGATATVRVVRDGRIEERAVQVGLRTLGAVEVQAGLAEGDILVLDKKVKSGARVRVQLVTGAVTASPLRARAEDAGSALTNAVGR